MVFFTFEQYFFQLQKSLHKVICYTVFKAASGSRSAIKNECGSSQPGNKVVWKMVWHPFLLSAALQLCCDIPAGDQGRITLVNQPKEDYLS